MGSVIDKETFAVIRKNVDFSEEEFMAFSDNERKEWVDACRLARILDSECHDLMFAGYNNTEMYSANGTFNLSAAACIVRSKKRTLGVIERYTDFDFTPAQFILMGDDATKRFENEAMRQINLKTAIELDKGKKTNTKLDGSQIVVTREKKSRTDLINMLDDNKNSSNEIHDSMRLHY